MTQIYRTTASVLLLALGVSLPMEVKAAYSTGAPSPTIPPVVQVAEGEGAPAPAPAAPKRALRTPPGTMVSIEWVDMDLEEITKRMAEMTGRNFIMGERLEGKKITIFAPNKVTVEEAYQAYLAALNTAGYTVVPSGGGALKVVKKETVGAEPIETVVGSGVRSNQTYITRIIKLENIGVDDITRVLGKLVSSEGSMVSYQPNNTLILTDTEANINRLMGIIQILDVESPRETLEVVPIYFADVNEVSEIIRQVYGDGSSANSRGGQTRNAAATRRTRRQPAGEAGGGNTTDVEGAASVSKIIADERTNSLIILATEDALKDIKALIEKLDYEVDPLLKSDIHVVFLQHAKAEELATTLANLTSDSARNSSRTQARPAGNNRTAGARTQAAGSTGGAVATFEGGVKVTADESTNSLVITASYNDYIVLKRVIDKLDVQRRQVFVEAVILELSQDKRNTLGISYHGGLPFPMPEGIEGVSGEGGVLIGRGSGSILPSLDQSTLAGMAMGVFGASIDVPLGSIASAVSGGDSDTVSIPAFGVFLQALQTDQDVNILSTPHILTLNNKEAKIVVGENVPFVTGQTITGTGLSTQNIQREDVALTLKIKPQINEGDSVTLEVFQEITEVVASTANSETGPTTTKRSAETTVNVMDNQTVVIGGLISSKSSSAEDKVPILGDIPLIGVLFRSTTTTNKKSNLLIFLTPHVVDSPEDLQDIYRIKMLQRQEFIRRFYGKSREEQLKELNDLLMYSMNLPGYESVYPDRPPRQPMEDTIDTEVPVDPRYGSHRGSFSGGGTQPEEEPGTDEMIPDVQPEEIPSPDDEPQDDSITNPPAGK